MGETKAETDAPTGKQVWWVDYNNIVRSGTLIDMRSGKAVTWSSDGYTIHDLDKVKYTYEEACSEAIKKLSSQQNAIYQQIASLMDQITKTRSKTNGG